MLADKYTEKMDPTAWWLSEKLDGVRAYWDGSDFYSRNGNHFPAPAWFKAGLPPTPLDGELWMGRGEPGGLSASPGLGAEHYFFLSDAKVSDCGAHATRSASRGDRSAHATHVSRRLA